MYTSLKSICNEEYIFEQMWANKLDDQKQTTACSKFEVLLYLEDSDHATGQKYY